MISIAFDQSKGKFVGTYNGKVVVQSVKREKVEKRLEAISGEKVSFAEVSETAKDRDARFGINARFNFVERLVAMVAAGVQPSAVITGEGGLGKTYTVLKTLEAAGYMDRSDLASFEEGVVVSQANSFIQVKGYSTAKGLYRTLYENRESVIVFDDCDSVLKDPVALNILKGALDSYGKRVISWNADLRDDDLPRSFAFNGRVIFISNLPQSSVDQAIRSRSIMIDLSMTSDQKIDRMEFIAASSQFLPEYEKVIVKDALSLLRELKNECRELSLRTLISVSKIRAANGSDWKSMAEYVLTS